MEATKQEREATLGEFIAKYAHLPEQGSIEWLNGRKLSFGGSEIASLIGEGYGKTKRATPKNTESQLKKLIAGKVGLDEFKGNLYTRWGNLFEHSTERFAELMFKTKLKFTGSLPGRFVGQNYSPDGLGVVKMVIDGREQYVIALFEFKAPFSKIPIGTIPNHYIPQVKTGMISIDIADIAIFINNTYRKCSVSQFDLTSSYNTDFHTLAKARTHIELKVISEVKTPIAMGFIYFSVDYEKLIDSHYYTQFDGLSTSRDVVFDSSDYDDLGLLSDSDVDSDSGDISDETDYELSLSNNLEYILSTKLKYIKTVSDILDLGAAGDSDTKSLFSMLDDGILIAHHSELFMNTNEYEVPHARLKAFISDEKKNVQSLFDNEKIFGVLPWKLLISDIIEQKRDNSFAGLIEPYIVRYCKVLHDILEDSHSEHDIYRKFYTHFSGIDVDVGIDRVIKKNIKTQILSDDMLNVLDDI